MKSVHRIAITEVSGRDGIGGVGYARLPEIVSSLAPGDLNTVGAVQLGDRPTSRRRRARRWAATKFPPFVSFQEVTP
jgi:hypothetical protein